ncbi:hypothetical protein [Ammoniphilus sp. CFH 90114]|uniref:hypothetical protein n=1 Tax=Ammoniphilus sp. CFH 90114 TaxID=2493665 RepID=UPI00100DA2E1|nr:hypothetical protein [Ammoniphilus sp. CFH 90114]
MIEKAIREIQAAQEQAYQTEKRYFEIMAQLVEARTQLLLKQYKLLREGKLTAKKEGQVEIQFIQHAKKEYLAVKELEKSLYMAEAEYRSAKRAWESWQAICLLQSGL